MATILYKRQRQILDYIDKNISDYGYAPTLTEIAQHLGLSSLSTVHEHLAVLEKKKFGKEEVVVICLSGRGDKDMETYLSKLSINSSKIK